MNLREIKDLCLKDAYNYDFEKKVNIAQRGIYSVYEITLEGNITISYYKPDFSVESKYYLLKVGNVCLEKGEEVKKDINEIELKMDKIADVVRAKRIKELQNLLTIKKEQCLAKEQKRKVDVRNETKTS